MSQYRIVCTVQEPSDKPHDAAHIVSVGTGEQSNKADRRWTLDQVLKAMDNGDTFYTVGKSTNETASVHKYTCKTCNRDTIRSGADAVTDNNLDSLRKCNFGG